MGVDGGMRDVEEEDGFVAWVIACEGRKRRM